MDAEVPMNPKWPELKGKRCLITGGSSGIGRALVKLLYDNDAHVVTCARDARRLEELAEELDDREGRLIIVNADIADAKGLDAVFDAVKSGLGGLDILVANAAVAGGSVHTTQEPDIDNILKINLFGQIASVRRALQQMEEGGRIVLIGSMSADVREEEGNVYVASKAGLQGFAGAFRKQANKQGIHVHLVEPGSVATPLHNESDEKLAEMRARGEMMLAEEVADCVAFILTRPRVCDIVSLQVRPHKQFI
jgi:NAD(P)-dependent dehydrogenase (short-subunit alcohol dehydrogenase family)